MDLHRRTTTQWILADSYPARLAERGRGQVTNVNTRNLANRLTVAESHRSSRDVVERDHESCASKLTYEFSQMGGRHLPITGGAGFLEVFDNYVHGLPRMAGRAR
jgi:hypothetical protein